MTDLSKSPYFETVKWYCLEQEPEHYKKVWEALTTKEQVTALGISLEDAPVCETTFEPSRETDMAYFEGALQGLGYSSISKCFKY